MSDISTQYNELLSRLETQNARQDNPLGLPTGYYMALDAKGESLGCGWYCPKCKISYLVNAPKEIKHCGTVTKFPTGLFAWMKIFGFKTHKLQRRYYY